MSYYTPKDLPTIEELARDAERRAADCAAERRARLLERHPVDFPRALAAAQALRRKIGVGETGLPSWLNGICGSIDGCGRPYVHVSLSQWDRRGKPRMFADADNGEVPEFPKKIKGIPVFVAVSGCFGERVPGHHDVPCVPLPDPPVAARIKKTVDNQLGDLGEFATPCDDGQLPSGRAWVGFVRDGNLGDLAGALGHTALRAALIGTGLWLVGARRDTLVRDAVAGSVGIDAFILAWTLWHSD